jgi:H+/Cl- antiporter ClcA
MAANWRPMVVRNLPLIPQRPPLAAVIVGLAGGVLGAAYLAVLHLLAEVLGPHRHGPLASLVILAGVGVAVAMIDRFIGPSGNIELLVDNIHVDGGVRGMRELRALIPSSLLCISAGGGLGPEAPLVQSAGSIASSVARDAAYSPARTRVLTIAGMASAFAVLFGAPLGAALFALELPHRRGLEHHEAIVPAVVGALTGLGANSLLGGHAMGPIWSTLPPVARTQPLDFAWAGLGVAIGVAIALAFVVLVSGLRRAANLLPVSLRPVVGGLVLGGLGWLSPYALTFGEFQLDPLLAAEAGGAAFLVAGLAKLAGTSVTVAAGWRGGFIIPLLFMGAALGSAFADLVPGVPITVLVVAAMVSANVGVTNTALGTAVVVTEMAGLHLLPTTLFAALLALALTPRLGLIGSQRSRSAPAQPPRLGADEGRPTE